MHEGAFAETQGDGKAFAFDVGGTYVDGEIPEIDDDADGVDDNDTTSDGDGAVNRRLPIGKADVPSAFRFCI